jgi:acyl-CoA synthetase (AMP-forming)/AMP-acid ligase II
MVKSGGANVSPLEVERDPRVSPDVRSALVFGVRDLGRRSGRRGRGADRRRIPDTEDPGPGESRALVGKVRDTGESLDEEDIPWLPSGKPDRTLRSAPVSRSRTTS